MGTRRTTRKPATTLSAVPAVEEVAPTPETTIEAQDTQPLASPTTIEESPTPDQLFLEQLDNDLPKLEAYLAELEEAHDTIEANEKQRASSPLALRVEVVGCTFAAEVWPTGPHASNIPQFVWGEMHCPFGKTTPDQECRDCTHHKIIPLGSNEPPHMRRYPRYGAVIPLTDEQASDVARLLKAMNLIQVRRPRAEIHATRTALANAKTAQEQARMREIERHQRGQL